MAHAMVSERGAHAPSLIVLPTYMGGYVIRSPSRKGAAAATNWATLPDMQTRARRALEDAVVLRPGDLTGRMTDEYNVTATSLLQSVDRLFLALHSLRACAVKRMTMLQRRAPDTMHQPREPGPERQSQTILPAHRGRHEMIPRAQQRALDDDAESRPGDLERRMIDDFTAAAASLSQRILRLFLAHFLRVCVMKRMAMLQRRDSDAMLQRTAGGELRDSGPAQSQPTLPRDMGRHAMLPRALRAHEDVTESRPADLERRRIDERTVESKCARAAALGGVANAFRPTEQEDQEEPPLVHCELCTVCPCSGAYV